MDCENRIAEIIRLGFVSIFLVVCHLSIAQSDDQASEEVEGIEEIVVTGERSIRSLRQDVELAQDAIFDTFNEIYAGTDYEMICTRERPIKDTMNPIANSWSVRTCRSRRAQELYDQQMEDYAEYIYLEENGYVGTLVDNDYYEDRREVHKEELFEKVRDLLEESPEYRQHFVEYAKAKSAYDAAVEADFEKGNFFTRLFHRGDQD